MARVSSLACRVSLSLPLVFVVVIIVKHIPFVGSILMVDIVFSGVLLSRTIIRLIVVF